MVSMSVGFLNNNFQLEYLKQTLRMIKAPKSYTSSAFSLTCCQWNLDEVSQTLKRFINIFKNKALCNFLISNKYAIDMVLTECTFFNIKYISILSCLAGSDPI